MSYHPYPEFSDKGQEIKELSQGDQETTSTRLRISNNSLCPSTPKIDNDKDKNKDLVNSEQPIKQRNNSLSSRLNIMNEKWSFLFTPPILHSNSRSLHITRVLQRTKASCQYPQEKKLNSTMSSNLRRSPRIASRSAAGSAAQTPIPVIGEHICTHAEPVPLGQDPRELPPRGILPLYQAHNISEVLAANHPSMFTDYGSGHGELREGKYCPLEMEEFVVARTILTPLPLHFVRILEHPIPATNTEEGLFTALITWYAIFDKWFFASALHGKVRLKLICDQRIPAFGWYNRATRQVSLNTHPALSRSVHWVGSREEHLTSTLLHELTHAFLTLYSCSRSCCSKFSHPSQGGIGSEGHGPAWADTATFVLSHLHRTVPWNVEFSIAKGVVESLCIDQWQPTAEQIEKWGLDEGVFGEVRNWNEYRLDFRLEHKLKMEAVRDLVGGL